jgi:exosortase E/protease (VPEID-CTERM system)
VSGVLAVAPAAGDSLAWKRLALGVLLVCEILYLTVSFDTQRLDAVASPWTMVAGWSPHYLRVATATVFVLLLLGVTSFSRPRGALGLTSAPISSAWVALHLLAFGVFAALTARFVTGAGNVAAQPALSTATWLLAGAAMLGSWVLAMYPRQRLWTALVDHRVVISWSVVAGVALWAARFMTETLWSPLAGYTYAVVDSLLRLIFVETVSQPDRLILGTPRFKVLISPECSGYEGIGLILGFLTVYLVVCRKELRFPGALILLPIGAIGIWLLNVARIVALIVIGASGWPAVATGGFHSQAGWLAFNALALGFVVLINRVQCFKTSIDRPIASVPAVERRFAERIASDPTTAYLGPFVALLSAAMVTGVFSAGFDWLYGVRVVAAAGALWICRGVYRSLDWRCSWRGFAIGAATAVMWIGLFPAALNTANGWPAALQSVSSLEAAAWLSIRLAGYVLVVPVVEELAFRVYLLRRLTGRDIDSVDAGRFSLVAVVVSSLLFGAMHNGLWIQGTLAGMAFACAMYRRQFGEAVLAHATTNGLIALYVFATGQWSVWS